MGAAAVIRHKTGDGGGALVIRAGHTTRGQMGGLLGAMKQRKLSREKGNNNGRSVAPCRSRGGDGEERLGYGLTPGGGGKGGKATRGWRSAGSGAQATGTGGDRRAGEESGRVGRPAGVGLAQRAVPFLLKNQINLNGFD